MINAFLSTNKTYDYSKKFLLHNYPATCMESDIWCPLVLLTNVDILVMTMHILETWGRFKNINHQIAFWLTKVKNAFTFFNIAVFNSFTLLF